MTLEEFLTLSDDKDGLTTVTRVEELISLMQKEKDEKVKSAGKEATRQNTAIARAIVETKNTHCLNHFVKLGGLSYINGWLNDALKSVADTSCDFIEEAITSQCRALEKLGISNEMLISSGILDTVKNLCDYNSPIVKDKAKELLNRWIDVDFSLIPKDVEKVDVVGDTVDDKSISKTDENDPLLEVMDVGPEHTETCHNVVEVRKEEDPDLGGSNELELVESEHIKAESTCSQMDNPVYSGQINMDGEAIGVISNTKATVPTTVCHSCVVTPMEGVLNNDNSISLDAIDNIGNRQTRTNESTNDGHATVTETIESASADLGILKFIPPSNLHKSEGYSSVADILMAEQTMPELETQTDIGCEEGLVPMRDEFVDDAKIVPLGNSSGMDDDVHQRLLSEGKRTSLALEALSTKTASVNVVGLNNRSDEDYTKVSAIQNLARDTKTSVLADTASVVDPDYGLLDALEVARQVAKAVKMDAVGDGSYENNSEGSRQPESPDSTNEIDSKSRNPSEESSPKLDSSQLSTERKVESSSSEKIHHELEECMQGVDQPESLAQEDSINTNTCQFDLNQEVTCESVEFSVNLNCNMPEENRSGVFHHLYPHRDSDPSGVLPSGISGKQKQEFFSIDLNLDREGNESNVAVAATKSEKLDFDLNMLSDADDAMPSSSWSLDKQNFSRPSGHPNSSPASSLFPMQPTINIDLSEGQAMQSVSSRPHPYLVDTSFSSNGNVHPFFGMPSQNVNVQKDVKPSISIMGALVEVNRNNYTYGAPLLSNGGSENHSLEANIGTMGNYLSVGPIGPYRHPPPFAYSNTNAGPTMSFISPMFRPGNTMTYMVDPRVGPLPQMVNPSSVVPHMYAQTPFFASMAGPPQSLNEGLPSRPNLDLNMGSSSMNEGGNGQDIVSRQLFSNNQGMLVGKQLSPPDLQPSSSFGKRKETEWETYSYNIKHSYPRGNR